jgi:predicted small secreted protein
MRIGTVPLVVMACAVLAACAPNAVKPFGQNIKCTGHDCAADVTVSSVGSTCIPDQILDIDLKTGDAGYKTITWKMATDGYEFSGESYKFGIFIKNNPFNEFKEANVLGNGKILVIKFNGTSSGKDYRYAITVRKSTGSKDFCDTLDPWMIS